MQPTIYSELFCWWNLVQIVVISDDAVVFGRVWHNCPGQVEVIRSLYHFQPSTDTTDELFIRSSCLWMLSVIQVNVTHCAVIFPTHPQHLTDACVLGLGYTPHEDRLPLPCCGGVHLKRRWTGDDGSLGGTCSNKSDVRACIHTIQSIREQLYSFLLLKFLLVHYSSTPFFTHSKLNSLVQERSLDNSSEYVNATNGCCSHLLDVCLNRFS